MSRGPRGPRGLPGLPSPHIGTFQMGITELNTQIAMLEAIIRNDPDAPDFIYEELAEAKRWLELYPYGIYGMFQITPGTVADGDSIVSTRVIASGMSATSTGIRVDVSGLYMVRLSISGIDGVIQYHNTDVESIFFESQNGSLHASFPAFITPSWELVLVNESGAPLSISGAASVTLEFIERIDLV